LSNFDDIFDGWDVISDKQLHLIWRWSESRWSIFRNIKKKNFHCR